MKRTLIFLLALALTWVGQAAVNDAHAHGGSYRPPVGEIPPGGREPYDPQPRPDGPGAPTSGGGAQTDPGGGLESGGGGGLTPPAMPGSNGPSPVGPAAPPMAGGALTGGRKVACGRPMSASHWIFWWANNRDEILNLKAAVRRFGRGASTKNSAHFFGEGSEKNRPETEAPTQRLIRERIVPSLLRVIEDRDMHPDIRAGALIALARCGDDPAHVRILFASARPEAEEDRIVMESAIVALGILQIRSPEIRDFLIEIVEDRGVPDRARCFALISLGLLYDGSARARECLTRRLDGGEPVIDVPVCALIAMGLTEDAGLVPTLLDWLKAGRVGTRELTELERAHVVNSLGRIGDPAALAAVSRQLHRRGALVRRSAAIAMGQILPRTDPTVQKRHIERLVRMLPEEPDATTRNFGLISLGRIAGAKDVDPSVRGPVVRYLLTAFADGNPSTEKPFSALALGLAGLCRSAAQPGLDGDLYDLADPIRKQLAMQKGDQVARGALALSLGMLGDRRPETIRLLTRILEDRGLEKRLRGCAALSLGLIGDYSAKPVILEALKERANRDLRTETAISAGLLGDSDAVELLVNILHDPRATQFEMGSVAMALGQVGDRRAVEPLLGILQAEKTDGSYPDLTRALVTVALGKVADQRDIRVLYRISKDLNYRATVPSLEEILTIL